MKFHFSSMKTKAIRGRILHFVKDPFHHNELDCFQYLEDGLLIIENGKICKVGDYSKLVLSLGSDIEITHYKDEFILPGFIDTHVHYPQIEVIASYGEQLLEWLNNFTFPAENKFKNKEYARTTAKFFLKELLRNGTTTASVFGTVHPQSVDAFFEETENLNMRMIAGKVMMDRNAPQYLLDTPELSYEETKCLIQKWHKKDRLLYAITPRFAITSSPEQLKVVSYLKNEFPDVYMQTHISENKAEVEMVSKLFPEFKNYLDVYDKFGMLGSKSIFAHGIYLSDDEFEILSEKKCAISFCPTSNLFLGSGLFNLTKAKCNNIKVGIGTDVGGGTTFSILKTLKTAYKTQQIQGQKLSIIKALYLATLGGAHALSLDDKIGNFVEGKEADFIILNTKATPLLEFRNANVKSIEELLFSLMILGDDRVIQATYIMGEKVYERE